MSVSLENFPNKVSALNYMRVNVQIKYRFNFKIIQPSYVLLIRRLTQHI